MNKLTWNEYYEGFYDWAPATQKSYAYRLADYGSADEVFEVALELACEDDSFATRFVEKALNAGVRFEPDHILELIYLIDEPILVRMAETASSPFSKEQLEELYAGVDEESFDRISRKHNIDIFVEDEDTERYEAHETTHTHSPGKSNLFSAFLLAFAGENSRKNKTKQHRGRCTGKCTTCPPHFGYRYGRWYYGKGHVRGCEFGGNKGDGSLP